VPALLDNAVLVGVAENTKAGAMAMSRIRRLSHAVKAPVGARVPA
jgi:hypothetical protein